MSKMEFVFLPFIIYLFRLFKAELELESDKASSGNVSSKWFQEELGLVKKLHIFTLKCLKFTAIHLSAISCCSRG